MSAETHTLTLSKVEQRACHLHLELEYNRLAPGHADAHCLHVVLTRLDHDHVISLSVDDAKCMLRHLRQQAFRLTTDMMALEERRMRGGYNGSIDAAYRALDADLTTLTDVIRRLWELV